MGSKQSSITKQPFPPSPTRRLDWNNLGVGVNRQVNGHIELKWTDETKTWSEPRFVQDPNLSINGMASGLNYGMQAYEGMKALRDIEGQVRIFRPDQHAIRMQHSCDTVSIPTISTELFTRCVTLAVSLNAEFVPPFEAQAALYVRPLAFGSGPQLNIIAPSEFTFCVFVQPTAALLGHAAPVSALVLEDFDRAAPRGTGSAKIGGNYAPSMKWQKSAKQEGYGLTLHLDSETRSEIEEFSAAGFIGCKRNEDGKPLIVVPDSQNVIKSVTSDSCVAIARSLGWEVQHRSIQYDELKDFDEVLAVGTAAIVVPIKSITRKSRAETITFRIEQEGGGTSGTCFDTLFKKILAAQRGLDPIDSSWSMVVKAPEL